LAVLVDVLSENQCDNKNCVKFSLTAALLTIGYSYMQSCLAQRHDHWMSRLITIDFVPRPWSP